jgi:hypothetical protein
VPDGAGLPGRPAAVHAHADVVRAFGAGGLERRERRGTVREAGEVVLDGAAVEPGRAVTGTQDHARDRRFALAGAEVLRRAGLAEAGTLGRSLRLGRRGLGVVGRDLLGL